MPSQARNQNHVPPEDLPFFIAATTAGIRRQLREAEIPAGGLKYDLYLRLKANGLRIYNDVRGSSEAEDSDESDWDDDEDEDEDEGGPEDDGSDDEEPESEPESGDSSDDDSSDSDDESSDDGPEVPPSGGRNRKKRKRGHHESDIEQDTELEVPEAPRPAELSDMPAELSIKIIRNLDARGVFNLVVASPQQFLDGNVDAFVLEAEGRRNAAGRIGLSLLEWVVARVANEVDFRTDNGRFVRRVVDAYLATYSGDSPQDHSVEGRVEEIMVWLRQIGVNAVLNEAVRQGEADIVQLLILLGEDVNHREDKLTPLERAAVRISPEMSRMNYLLITFALLAAGADNTSTRKDYPETDFEEYRVRPFRGVSSMAENSYNTILQGPILMWSPDFPTNWPVILNPRELTIRQFLADERSPFMDRARLALALLITRETVYPYFEGYVPKNSDRARTPLELFISRMGGVQND